MKIKYIKIKNFKLFDDFEINFTSNKNKSEKEIELDFVTHTKDDNHVIPYLNYIIGRNSIGKTTIFEAIKFVVKFVTNEQEKTTKENLLLKKEFEFREKSWKEKENHDWFQLMEKQKKEFDDGKYDEIINKEVMKIYREEYLKFAKNIKKPIEITLCFDQKQDFLIKLIYPSYSVIKDLNSIYKPNFNIKNKTNELIQKFKIWAENTFYFTKIEKFSHIDLLNSGLNEMLLKLIEKFSKNKESKTNLNKLIKLADPQFDEFILKNGPLRYSKNGVSNNLDIETFSFGTKKFIKFLYWILEFAEKKFGLLMIDEIENHLHKELINVIKIGLNTIATKYDLQVILTTHNPLILREFAINKQVISLDDDENKDNKIIATKVSSKIKPNNNIIKKYENNTISTFPSLEYSKKISRDIFKKW